MTPLERAVRLILDENEAVLTEVDEAAVDRVLHAVRTAQRVFLLGEGRSGLVMRMLAMRLMHLGFAAHVVGETTTPAIGAGDLLLACSGSGETEVTCLLAEKALAAGARLATITADPASRLGRTASIVIALPTPHKHAAGRVDSVQYGGSLFEQSALLLSEAMVLRLLPRTAAFDDLSARHANLE